MTTLNLEKISIVHWYPDLEKHRCGYCKNEKCSISDGMWAEQLTVEDYQNLIDRGWRRSGKYCYKPIMDETCCPLYTIRCEALKFHPSKSQKKVIKRFNRFLTEGVKSKEEGENSKDDSIHESNLDLISRPKPNVEVDFSRFKDNVVQQQDSVEFIPDTNVVCVEESIGHKLESEIDVPETDNKVQRTAASKGSKKAETQNSITDSSTEKSHVKKGVGPDPNKPACKKAKQLRLERKQQKMLQRGMSLEKLPSQNAPKSLEQLIDEIPENVKSKLKIVLVSTSSKEEDWEKNKVIEYEIYRKYQMTVHNDPPEKCNMEGFLRFLVNTPLKITIERVNRNHPHFKIEAKLFEKYQMAVHDEKLEDCDENQFYAFLVDTPLLNVRARSNGSTVNFGSYHQQYWIEDKLVAVGVIDILPKCISSVYFFYDPDYRFLTLGTYGSLREIYFVRYLHEKIPSIEYYYMGYYIHSCPKMRYKGRLSNSFLLCPETYKWFPIENCIPKLDASKYARLNDDIDDIDENDCTSEDIDRIKILIGYSFTVFKNYKRTFGEHELYQKIGRLIGKKCVDKLLFISMRE